MIKRLLKSVREFKKDALLTPFFVVLEVVMEVIRERAKLWLTDRLTSSARLICFLPYRALFSRIRS